jgi:hypothetical protein
VNAFTVLMSRKGPCGRGSGSPLPVSPAPPSPAPLNAIAALMQGAREQAMTVAAPGVGRGAGAGRGAGVGRGAGAGAGRGSARAPAPTGYCPFYKRIPGTPFIVDGFKFACPQLSRHYILTHFHRCVCLCVAMGRVLSGAVCAAPPPPPPHSLHSSPLWPTRRGVWPRAPASPPPLAQ